MGILYVIWDWRETSKIGQPCVKFVTKMMMIHDAMSNFEKIESPLVFNLIECFLWFFNFLETLAFLVLYLNQIRVSFIIIKLCTNTCRLIRRGLLSSNEILYKDRSQHLCLKGFMHNTLLQENVILDTRLI